MISEYREPSTTSDETMLLVDEEQMIEIDHLAIKYEHSLASVSDSDAQQFTWFGNNFCEILRYHELVSSILNAVTNRPGTNILLSNAGARRRYFDMVTNRVREEILRFLKHEVIDQMPRFTPNSNLEPVKYIEKYIDPRERSTVPFVHNSKQNIENYYFRIRTRNERKLRIAEEWYKWMIEEKKVKQIDLNLVDNSVACDFLLYEMFAYASLEKLPSNYVEESDELNRLLAKRLF